MKNKYIFGSVSHGTMREQDLIPVFIDTVSHFSKTRAKKLQKEFESCLKDDLSYFLNETLFDVLNEYTPPYFYFGAHPGDGADYGFWLIEGFESDFDGLKVDDLSELDTEENKGYIGEVLYINDHGNSTLYWKSARKLKEIWSIV